MPTAVADAPLAIADFGGRYIVRENADGTFSFLNVPIVGELAKGARPDYPELVIDKAWLDSAYAALKAGEADDFLPPLNLHHHNSPKPVEHIGFIRARGVRKISYRGKTIYALFADLDRVPLSWAQQIAKGRLPYCSIEGPVKGPGDVKSLAMLTDEPPQFGFPIITAGALIPHMTADVALPEPDGPWAVMSTTRGSLFIEPIFAFAYESDGKDEKPKDKESDGDGKDKGEFGKKKDGEEEDEDDDGEDEGEAEAMSEEDSEKIENKAVALGLAKMLDVLQRIEKALIPPKDAAGGTETGHRGPLDPAHMSETKTETTVLKDPEAAGQLAAMRSEIASLKAKDDARTAKDAAAARVTKAKGELAGFHIDATMEEELAYFSALGDEPLAKYVASVKRNGTKDPEGGVEDIIADTKVPDGTEDILKTYTGDRRKLALAAARTHARLSADPRNGFAMSLPDYIAHEVALASGKSALALRGAPETDNEDE